MSKTQPKLGKYLKNLRDASRLSLRAVEKETGISNAMLSQLESGRVKQPSPIFLYKLAELYGIPYEVLMELDIDELHIYQMMTMAEIDAEKQAADEMRRK